MPVLANFINLMPVIEIMDISPDTNPVDTTRLSPASITQLRKKGHAAPVSTVKDADVFHRSLLADLSLELKKMPEVRNDVVATAAHDIDAIDLKELGSRLAAELNHFDPSKSK